MQSSGVLTVNSSVRKQKYENFCFSHSTLLIKNTVFTFKDEYGEIGLTIIMVPWDFSVRGRHRTQGSIRSGIRKVLRWRSLESAQVSSQSSDI